MAGNGESRLARLRDFYDAAASVQRGGDVQIIVDIKSHSLRTAQPAIKHADFAVRIDLMNRIEARGRRSRYVQITVIAEGQVISGNTRFDRSENENLPIAPDLEDGSAAIADVQVALAIEGNAGCHAHTFGIRRHRPILRDAVHGAIVPR